MAYRYSSNTSQFGTPHTNIVVAVKVDPAGNQVNEVLDSTVADVNGDFSLSWNDWSGRVAIGAFDDDEAQRLQCVFVDGQNGLETTGRYSGFTTLAPTFFYALNDVSPWAENIDANASLVVAPTYTAPTTGYAFVDYIGAKGVSMASNCLLTEENAGATSSYAFASELSVAFLLRPGNDILSEQVVCGYGDWSSNDEASNIQWAITIKGSQLHLQQQYGSGNKLTVTCSQALIENKDIFVTVTRDATVNNTVRFYFNGELVSSSNSFTSQRPTGGANGKFCVGGAYQGALNYDGAISCLYGTDRALSDAQIRAMHYQAQNWYQSYLLGISDLVFLWPLRETSGQVAYDISGNARNGTHNTGITVTTPAPAELGGTAVAFREQGTAARYIDRTTFWTLTGSFTVGGWFQVSDLEYDYATYVNLYNSTSDTMSLRLDFDTLTQQVRTFFDGGADNTFNGVVAVEGEWALIVVNFDVFTGDIEIYKNGVLSWSCKSIPTFRRGLSIKARFGHTYGSAPSEGYFKGYMAGLFHIDRIMSASEIAALYAASNYTD